MQASKELRVQRSCKPCLDSTDLTLLSELTKSPLLVQIRMGCLAFESIALGSWHSHRPNPRVQRKRRKERLLLGEAQ